MAETVTIEQLQARIFGHVQGVGFRYFTLTRARQLSLAGWVRNDPDGSVELVVEGPPATLDTFEDMLSDGPPVSEVERVEAERRPATGDLRGFQIKP